MPSIEVTITRVRFFITAGGYRSGRFYCSASVDGRSLPLPPENKPPLPPRARHITRQTDVNLNWSCEVDVTNKESVTVEFSVHEGTPPRPAIAGARWVVRNYHEPEHPFRVILSKHGREICEVTWTYAPTGVRTPQDLDPQTVIASREMTGRTEYTSVSGTTRDCRVEIHPVMPPPTAPRAALPIRPANTAWRTPTGPWTTNYSHTDITAGDPLNVIPNPAVIPILSRWQRMGRKARTRAARIQFTYYRPRDLNFTVDDRRLTWRAVTADGAPEVRFVGNNRGREVLVYGVDNGQDFDATNIPEVMLEVMYNNTVIAKYRALVMKLRKIVTRAVIIEYRPPRRRPSGAPPPPPAAIPTTRSSDELETHRKIVNRYLRQVGVEMVWDRNNTITTRGTTRCHRLRNGRFLHRAARRDWTFDVEYNYGIDPPRVNARDGVLNIAYVCSIDGGGILGMGTDYPANGAGLSISDNAAGRISSSWIKPTGVSPDRAAGTSTMTLLGESPGRPDNKISLVIANPGASDIGKTIAHEIGHMFCLGHRVEGLKTNADATSTSALNQMTGDGQWCDRLWSPPRENVMHWTAGNDNAIDFDLIQAKAIHQSPLVTDA